MKHFADRLIESIQNRGNPVCVGLDPLVQRLPKNLQQQTSDRTRIAQSFCQFCKAIIDVVAPMVPAVKPQAAFFEMYGEHGWRALSEVVVYAQEKGLIVIMDAKRGDIGSTAEAYASAYLDRENQSGLCSDALTVNPYLGDDALLPFTEVAIENGNGLFVLVKTSNPGGKLFQDLESHGKTVHEHVASYVESCSANSIGNSGYGAIGAVVGATYPAQLDQLRAAMPHTLFLVPGFGAQGGKAADVAGAFDGKGLGAIVNSSRNIIFAHARPEFADIEDWQQAVELATKEMIEQLSQCIRL